jgi:phenylacetate-coenzyme A ligase PaaK-like adenylate-forming protein
MLTQELLGDAMRRAQESERLAPAAFAALQERRLRDLLRFAVGRAPFYARLYQGIDVERAPLTALPPITKEQVQRHFDEVVTDRRLHLDEVRRFCLESGPHDNPVYLGEFVALMSSGTTGLRGCYVWDAATLADAVAVGFRQSNWPPPPPGTGGGGGGQRIAAIIQVDPSDATNVLMSLIPASVGAKRLIDIRQDLAAILAELNAFQPTLLAAYPYMLWLLSEAARDGRLHIRPRRITSSADVLTAADRAALRSVFGVEPYNYYCSTEVPYLAWECDAHDGLHVNADYVLLESVDAGNRPVPAGTLGDKILITNLSNRAMPLIRYEMSDQVEWTTGDCPCGCRLPRIRTVAGRVEHLLSLPGTGEARVRIVEEYVDDIVGRLEGVTRYQVIQDGPARLTVNVVVREPAPWDEVRRSVLDGLGRCFRQYGVAGDRVELDLRRVEQLEPVEPGSRKVCRFWNRCR